jgi:nucleotide-binding universal stress UspA family protein
MIRKILVALDPDSDTAVATRYATDIARRFGASVTGLAVVDLGSIESGARGGGIGSFYYAEKLKEKLTAETRTKARELLEIYDRAMQGADVEYSEHVKEGVPFQRIVEDMKYHDLLVIGREPHFFYGHPKSETPDTLARVVKTTVSPTIVVGKSYTTIRRVVIAYDGSDASARSARDFAYMMPFGRDVNVHVVNVYSKDPSESELLLSLMEKFLKAHDIEATTASVKSRNPHEAIMDYTRGVDADLLVAGAHSVSGIKRIAFGSITEKLLKDCPLPMFLNQ